MIRLQLYLVTGMGVKREGDWTPNLKWDERVCGIICSRTAFSEYYPNKKKFFIKELELDFIFLLSSFLQAGLVHLSFRASYQRDLAVRIKLMQRNSRVKVTYTLTFFHL